ncbi:ribbon-helix-helix protein, CopG family [Candidatus Bathyarchaeota archaeon]|nr:ribbon-helix-helix protein, CopG family [Candidatus Bathyarchaeota archaeon]
MVQKISISISEELDRTLSNLAKENRISKSRLIENYLRENPKVITELITRGDTCSLCHTKIGKDEVKVNTPRYGVLCLSCWTEKQGELFEEHPLHVDRG